MSGGSAELLPVIAGLAALPALVGPGYVPGVSRRPLNRKDLWRALSFAAGWGALAVALLPPLDHMAEDIFSAHMAQHLLLAVVAAPLFALSRPGQAIRRTWPAALWRGAMALPLVRPLLVVIGWLARPIPIWTLFSAAFLFWHLPGPYRWSLSSPLVHAVEHLLILGASWGFWVVVLGPQGRGTPSGGERIVMVVSAAFLGSLPGALMVFATRPVFGVTASSAAEWGLTPATDQQLAGVLMWIPASITYLGAICLIFWTWMGKEERKGRRPVLRVPLVICALIFGFATTLPGFVVAQGATTGDPDRGLRLIERVGCGTCHIIPGVRGAIGLVGPPLEHMGRRIYVAGLLRNTPSKMTRWIRDPQAIVPGNAMPTIGLDVRDSRDIAAYLATLE